IKRMYQTQKKQDTQYTQSGNDEPLRRPFTKVSAEPCLDRIGLHFSKKCQIEVPLELYGCVWRGRRRKKLRPFAVFVQECALPLGSSSYKRLVFGADLCSR